jgi:trimeric autotransporter adhesin
VVILCFSGNRRRFAGQRRTLAFGSLQSWKCLQFEWAGAAHARIPESKLSKSFMLRLKWSRLIAKVRVAPGLSACILGSLLFLASGPAYGQDFTLSASAFNPYAINQGGSTLSTVTLDPINGFSGSVDLVCAVTSTTLVQNAPTCQVSPTSVTPAGSASLTFSGLTSGGATAAPGSYVVTVTGTSGSLTHQQSLNISVLAVAPSYTVTVQRPVQPNAVNAGAGATALININSVNGYTLAGRQNGQTQGVWLACATVSPLVIYPPVCIFNPQPAQVTGTVTQVTLTIQTSGNAQKTSNVVPRSRFFALWLPLPLLAFAGIGAASSKRSRKAWVLLGLLILTGSLMLVPGCGNTTTGNTAPTTTIVTPKNTYTFSLVGTDTDGVISTNSGTGAPTVTLTVN